MICSLQRSRLRRNLLLTGRAIIWCIQIFYSSTNGFLLPLGRNHFNFHFWFMFDLNMLSAPGTLRRDLIFRPCADSGSRCVISLRISPASIYLLRWGMRNSFQWKSSNGTSAFRFLIIDIYNCIIQKGLWGIVWYPSDKNFLTGIVQFLTGFTTF